MNNKKFFELVKLYSNWLINLIPEKYHFFEARMIYYLSKILNLDSQAIVLNSTDIKRKKDTIFIMGSGYSINDIKKEEWNHFNEVGDIFSFNYFFEGHHISIDYHVMRETDRFRTVLLNRNIFEEYCNKLFNNLCYRNAIFFLLYDHRSPSTTWSAFFLKLFKNKKICFYKNLPDRKKIKVPSDDINKIPHCGATLCDVINLAYILGYKKIVLVGIDLYDRRYFWLGEEETFVSDLKRNAGFKDIHNTAPILLKAIKIWQNYLREKDVEIYIYNPKSLLNKILPVYKYK